MEVKIEITSPQKGKFADIKLCYLDNSGTTQKVPLIIEFDDLYEFSRETNSISFELFLISSIIYGIDNLIRRNEYSLNGWTRDIKVSFPVYNVDNWNATGEILEKTLNFLTGDIWDISFEKLEFLRLFSFNKKTVKAYDKDNYEYVSLFSGGLDSLVGAIDILESLEPRKHILLVSHFDGNAAGPNKDQTTLNSFLESKYRNKSNWIQGRVRLQHNNSIGEDIEIETSYRSRSLLFIAIGVYLLNSTNNKVLTIPENGTISLNYPLNPSRSSSLSTRTTHPYFFLNVEKLFASLGLGVHIDNPYKFLTKGELISNCKNVTNLKEICEASVSCSKSGRKMYWDEKKKIRHCGVCIPCFFRRCGLYSINFDNQTYGINVLEKESPESFGDTLALANFIKTPFTIDEIKRNIIINSSISIGNLDEYADLVVRSIDEVKKWINDKGNSKLKELFGL